jgi:hypothetical protein
VYVSAPGTLPSPDSCFTNYVKVAFFSGTSLRPVPRRSDERVRSWRQKLTLRDFPFHY